MMMRLEALIRKHQGNINNFTRGTAIRSCDCHHDKRGWLIGLELVFGALSVQLLLYQLLGQVSGDSIGGWLSTSTAKSQW